MNRKIANIILDKVKDGYTLSPESISKALRFTGDIRQNARALDLDGWIERRKTIRMAKGKAVGI
jgi:hypothetical protein